MNQEINCNENTCCNVPLELFNFNGCCDSVTQPEIQQLVIKGRELYIDGFFFGFIQSAKENTLSVKIVSENRFLNGMVQEITYFIGNHIFSDKIHPTLEDIFYSFFKKRKKIKK